MPRTAAPSSLEDLLRAAMAPVLRRISAEVARAAAEIAAKQLESELARPGARGRGRGRGRAVRPAAAAAAGRRSRPRVEVTRWIPDRRARRVPRFVIEATGGLDTKKKIVAKFGADAVFEKGRPLPRAKG